MLFNGEKNMYKIESVINSFPDGYEFKEMEIIKLLENVNTNTIRWALYNECQLGNITKIGTKLYKKGNYKTYKYELLSNESEIAYNLVKEYFPNLKISIWDEKILNEWLNLLLSKNIVFVEVEKPYIDFVYEKFKDKNLNVLLESQFLNESYNIKENIIIIRKLVSKAPINVAQNKTTLEKLVVDLLFDKLFIKLLDTNEINNLVKNIFNHYLINKSKILTYADRKNKKFELIEILKDMEIYK